MTDLPLVRVGGRSTTLDPDQRIYLMIQLVALTGEPLSKAHLESAGDSFVVDAALDRLPVFSPSKELKRFTSDA